MRARSVVAWGLAPLLLMAVPGAADPDHRVLDAVKKADQAALRALLQQRVDVNGTEADGTSALHWAVHLNDLRSATLLIAAGANANATNRYGVGPLALACTNGNARMVQALLAAGASANAATPEGETVLMTAARNGNPDVVKLLVTHGANPNAKESWRQQTALMWAAAENNVAVVKVLLEDGADINARSGDMRTPDGSAAPNADGVSRSRNRGGFTPFLFAVRAGHDDTVKALLDAGAKVNDALPDGTSALHLAIMNAHYELGAFLIEHGGDPNNEGPGWTPLHQLAWTRRPNVGFVNPPPVQTGNIDSIEFVEILLANGASPNAREKKEPRDGNRNKMDRTGASPFLLAAKGTDVELMRLLAEHGADPLLPTAEGTTPLMAAAGVGIWMQGESPGTEAEALEAVKVALELGGSRVDVNTVDANGNTALHGAAFRGANSIVQFLIEKGATQDVRNIAGWTPLTIANGVFWPNIMNRFPNTATLLRKLGSKDLGIDRCPQDLAVDCFRMLTQRDKGQERR